MPLSAVYVCIKLMREYYKTAPRLPMFLSFFPGPFPGESCGVHLQFAALSEILSVGVCVAISLPGCRKTQALEYLNAFQISLFCYLAPLSTPLPLIMLLLVSFFFFPFHCLFVCERVFCHFSSYVLMNWRNAQSFTISLSGNGWGEWQGDKQTLLDHFHADQICVDVIAKKINVCVSISLASFIQHRSDGGL